MLDHKQERIHAVVNGNPCRNSIGSLGAQDDDDDDDDDDDNDDEDDDNDDDEDDDDSTCIGSE